MSEEIAERVMQVVARTQRVPRGSISLASTLQDLGADSYDRINIVFALEDEFDITLPDAKVKNIQTLKEAVEGIEVLLCGTSAGRDSCGA